MRNSILNPYIVYALSWALVLLLYDFAWSEMFPPISNMLYTFIISTSIVSLILGLIFLKKRYFAYHKIKYAPGKIRKLTTIYVVLNILEIVYSRHIPILSIVLGGKTDSTNYGIPILHPLVVTLGIFLGLYIFHMIISVPKEYRSKLYIYYMLSYIGVFVIYGRGLMFMTILGCAIIYAMSKKLQFKQYILLCAFSIVTLFFFGLFGNIRVGELGVDITKVGQASSKFENSGVPTEFFWSYIYMTSPIANLEYNIESTPDKQITFGDVGLLYMSEIIPQFISNKIISAPVAESKLIVESLNVPTVYARCYSIAGEKGMWIMFLHIIFYIFIVLALIPKSSEYFVVSIVVLDILMVGNVFDNMMNYILSYTVLYAILFSVLHKYKFRIR